MIYNIYNYIYMMIFILYYIYSKNNMYLYIMIFLQILIYNITLYIYT